LKYLCLADSCSVDATSLSDDSKTKPTSNDSLPLPLPWCVDRVGATAASATVSGGTDVFIISNYGHKPPLIPVCAQAKLNWEPSHFLATNVSESGSVNESVSTLCLKHPPPSAASLVPSQFLPRPLSMSVTKATASVAASKSLLLQHLKKHTASICQQSGVNRSGDIDKTTTGWSKWPCCQSFISKGYCPHKASV